MRIVIDSPAPFGPGLFGMVMGVGPARASGRVPVHPAAAYDGRWNEPLPPDPALTV